LPTPNSSYIAPLFFPDLLAPNPKLTYQAMLMLLSTFTLLDTLSTPAGLSVGLAELNPLVTALGINLWVIFRLVLLAYLLAVFLVGYRYFQKQQRKTALLMLKASLVLLNIFIGAIVVNNLMLLAKPI
jgi:Flp pilus assembly protein TadB